MWSRSDWTLADFRRHVPRIIAERDAAVARVAELNKLADRWADLLRTYPEHMTTEQRNAWRDALAELRAVLGE